jgi:hypothetical protein
MHKFFLTAFCFSAGVMAMEEGPIEIKAQPGFVKSWQDLLRQEQEVQSDYAKKQGDIFKKMMPSRNEEDPEEEFMDPRRMHHMMFMMERGHEDEMMLEGMGLPESLHQDLKKLEEEKRKALEPFQERKKELLEKTDDREIINTLENLGHEEAREILKRKQLEKNLISEFFMQKYNESIKTHNPYYLTMILETQKLSDITHDHLLKDIIKYDYLLNDDCGVVFLQILSGDKKIEFLQNVKNARSKPCLFRFLGCLARDPQTTKEEMNILWEIIRQNRQDHEVIYPACLFDITERKFDGKPFASDEMMLDLYKQGDSLMKRTVFGWVYAYQNTNPEREKVRLEIAQRHNREPISWKDLRETPAVSLEIEDELEALKTARPYAFNTPSYNKKLAEITAKIPQEFQKRFLTEIHELRLAPGIMPDEDKNVARMGEYLPYKGQEIDYPTANAKEAVSHDWVELMKQQSKYKEWKEEKIEYNPTGFDCFIDQKGNPVGYHAFVPQNSCNKIIVEVYGGWQKTDLDKAYNNTETTETRLWNAQGYTVIRLNGLDLWENTNFQSQMYRGLHNDMLSGCAYFIKALKNGVIKDLEFLKDCDVFLQGHSFGGATVVRFVQEYPNLVSGVISINGALSPENQDFYGYLYPYGQESELEVPALLMATTVDNRVPLERSILDFYQKTICFGSKDISVYVHPKGNLSDDKLSTYVGHYLPTQEAFGVMLGFTQGRNNNSSLNDYRLAKAEILSALTKNKPALNEEGLLELYKKEQAVKFAPEDREYKLKAVLFQTAFKRAKTGRGFGYKALDEKKDFVLLKNLKELSELALDNLEELEENFVDVFKNHYAEIGFEEEISKNVAKERMGEIDWKKALDPWILMAEQKPFTQEEAMICETFGRFAARQELSKKAQQYLDEFKVYTKRLNDLNKHSVDFLGDLFTRYSNRRAVQVMREIKEAKNREVKNPMEELD